VVHLTPGQVHWVVKFVLTQSQPAGKPVKVVGSEHKAVNSRGSKVDFTKGERTKKRNKWKNIYNRSIAC